MTIIENIEDQGQSIMAAVCENAQMAPRYVIRTIGEDWIDLFDPPSRIGGKRPAWEEARRRVRTHPECKTVVIDRYTGVVLWQSDPDFAPQLGIPVQKIAA